jgi:hypothetical protein
VIYLCSNGYARWEFRRSSSECGSSFLHYFIINLQIMEVLLNMIGLAYRLGMHLPNSTTKFLIRHQNMSTSSIMMKVLLVEQILMVH